MIVTDTSLRWQSALIIAQASIEYAEKNKLRVCVSVLDRHGHPLVQIRVNNTPFPCTEISQNKAYTAVSFGFPTQDWNRRLEGKPSLLQGLSQQKRMVMFGGGLPVRFDDEIIGSVGVSGASEQQDEACAQAGVIAFQRYSENHHHFCD